jgi:hypothetical protein
MHEGKHQPLTRYALFSNETMCTSSAFLQTVSFPTDRLKMFGSVSLEMLKQDCNDMQRVSKHVIEGIK